MGLNLIIWKIHPGGQTMPPRMLNKLAWAAQSSFMWKKSPDITGQQLVGGSRGGDRGVAEQPLGSHHQIPFPAFAWETPPLSVASEGGPRAEPEAAAPPRRLSPKPTGTTYTPYHLMGHHIAYQRLPRLAKWGMCLWGPGPYLWSTFKWAPALKPNHHFPSPTHWLLPLSLSTTFYLNPQELCPGDCSVGLPEVCFLF